MLRVTLLLVCWTLCTAVPRLSFVSWTRMPDGSGQFLPFLNTGDRMAYDDEEHYLYIIGGVSEQLHIVDIQDTASPTIVYAQTFNEITDGIPKAIAVCSGGGREDVAIAFSAKDALNEGHVEVFRRWKRFDQDFPFLGRVATESDPSAVKFVSTCQTFVVTCEGLPGMRGSSFEDPVPHTDIFQREVDGWSKIPINFIGARGLDQARYIYKDQSIGGHSVQNDLEPSDLVIDNDDNVYITFHENNAIAKFNLLDLTSGIDIYSLGVKDWNNFDIDTSDMDDGVNPGQINMVRRNMFSFHQPKRLELLYYNSDTYLLTPNTGGVKIFTQAEEGVDFSEVIRARLRSFADWDPNLDTPTRTQVADDAQLGRLLISNGRNADDGWDGTFGFYTRPVTFGARSWGMWNANGVTELYDSGSDLEYEAALYNASIFNGDCFGLSMSPPQHLDTRSDDMGVEPSVITTGTFNSQQIVVVGSGRMGGIWVYLVEDSEAPGLPTGTFQSYTRLGDINGNWQQLYANGLAGVQHISDMLMTKDSAGNDILIVLGSQMGAAAIFRFEDGAFP